MIAVRLQFAQSSVREAARRGKGGLGNFIRLPELQQLAGSQEPGAKSVCVTAAGESRGGGMKLNRSRQQTRFIFTEGKAISICRLRVRARKLIVSGAAFCGDTDTSSPSPIPRAGRRRLGWSWRLRRLIAAVMREPRPWRMISAGGELFNETLISISRLR